MKTYFCVSLSFKNNKIDLQQVFAYYLYYNFEMVLGIGLVSAVIINKRRPDYKTRLQKLQQKLSKNPKKTLTVYQLPVKNIISLLVLVCFIIAFQGFERHFFAEAMGQPGKGGNGEVSRCNIGQDQKSKQKASLVQEEIKQFGIKQQSNQKMRQICENQQKIVDEKHDSLMRVSNAIFYIKIAYCLMILALLSRLSIKKTIITNPLIRVETYPNLGWLDQLDRPQSLVFNWETMQIQIRESGSQKFTHNSVHYLIEVVDRVDKRTVEIVRRGHVFQARKTLLEICSVLGIQADLSIH